MIFTQTLHISFLFMTFFPLLNAQHHLRVRPPKPTAPPHFMRRSDGCGATATLCADSSGDCCDIGAACTYDENGIPVCDIPCGYNYNYCAFGECCKPGYACNDVLTRCEESTMVAPTFTLAPPVIPTPSILNPPIIPTKSYTPRQHIHFHRYRVQVPSRQPLQLRRRRRHLLLTQVSRRKHSQAGSEKLHLRLHLLCQVW